MAMSLSVEESALIKPAMVRLKIESSFASVNVWGKMYGAAADYVIVVAVEASEDYPTKRFYYWQVTPPVSAVHAFALFVVAALISSDANLRVLFSQAPLFELIELKAGSAAVAESFSSEKLSGDPARLIKEGGEEPGEDEGKETDSYSEAEHLGYLVSQVDHHTAVVPRGAFYVSPTHEVQQNPSFSGLSNTECTDLSQYFHFRSPADPESVLDKSGMIRSTDFLDCITSTHVKGGWAVVIDASRTNVTLRSLVYPGYEFVHEIGTTNFRGTYFGDGKRNGDIAFMI